MSYAPLPRSESSSFELSSPSSPSARGFPPSPPSSATLPTHYGHSTQRDNVHTSRRRLVIACAVGLLLVAALTGASRRGMKGAGESLSDLLAHEGAEGSAEEGNEQPQAQAHADEANKEQQQQPAATSSTVAQPSTAACTNSPIKIKPLNVRPNPRPPPPCTSPSERYLTYENHSGFHNQGSTLTNALFLAEYLNRTLLLPPARVGMAAPWRSDLANVTEMHERCKATVMRLGKGAELEEECLHKFSRPEGWSYIAWDFVMSPALLEGRAIVDRWNGSQAWLEAPRAEGGMEISEEETFSFIPQDTSRRSYQLYELRETPDHLARAWNSRIDLPDLRLPPYSDQKLLRFGSLFGNGRIDLATEAMWKKRDAIYASGIIEEQLLKTISDEIKSRLGTYIGVHLRTGDGTFQWTSRETFPVIFRKIAHDLLGVELNEVQKLLALSAPIADKLGWTKPKPWLGSLGTPGLLRRVYPQEEEGEEDDFISPSGPALHKRQFDSDGVPPQPFWPVPAGHTRALSRTLNCRKPLYPPSSPLSPLNTPIYIATDARHPDRMAPFVPFLQHLPCLFFLDDFSHKLGLNKGVPVEGLVGMREGRRKSEWDGQTMAPHLFGFLDAMLAAKGDAMLGTPMSTFSSYTYNVLHKHYAEEWLAAGPPSTQSASKEQQQQPSNAPMPDGGL